MSMIDTYAPSGGVSTVLAKSKLGVLPLVFTVMAAAAPLTVVAGGATAGFAVTGALGIPLAYLVIAAMLAVFAVGYVAMSRRIVNAGAFYTYIAHGLGKAAGVSGAFVAVAAYNVMQVGLYGGMGFVTAGFIESQTSLAPPPWWACALASWLIIAFLGGRRVDLNSRVLSILLIAEILIAVIFAAVQVTHPAGGTVTFDTLSPGNLIGPGLGAALATAIAGFVGFEGTAVFSEEARDPRRTIPRATYLALALIGLLYAFCAWALSVATGPANIVQRSIDESSDLTFSIAALYLPNAVIVLGKLLFITSLFAALLAFHNTAARYHYALGREGVFPRWTGRTSPKTAAPLNGSLIQTAVGFAGIALFALAGWDPFTQMFFWLTVLGGLGVLILMTATSVAVAVYFSRAENRTGVGAGRGLAAPLVAALALGSVLVVTLDQFATLLGVDPAASTRWLLPGGYLVAAVAGLLWAFYLRSARPDGYARIGGGGARVDG